MRNRLSEEALREGGDERPCVGAASAAYAVVGARRRVGQEPRVLRLCSVYQTTAVSGRGKHFDAVGGMQNHTAQLTRALDRLGVPQTVVTAWRPDVPRRVRIGHHSTLRREGYPIRRLRQGYWLPAARIVLGNAGDYDLVHVHLGEDLAVVPLGVLAAACNRRPLVLTVHVSLRYTLRPADLRGWFLRWAGAPIERWGEQHANAVIVLTDRLRRRLIDAGVDEARIRVIPSGFDPDLFDSVDTDPMPQRARPRIVYVGRLAPQKGVATLLVAIARLRDRRARLAVVGDGPLRGDLERRARALGIADRVTFVGQVPHRRVPAWLSCADVVVLPSVYEELGSVLIEGMRVGAAIVASRVGGIPDVIDHGDNGLLVPPEDPGALAAALDRLLADPALRQRLGAASRERSGRYSWDALARQTLDVYRAVVSS